MTIVIAGTNGTIKGTTAEAQFFQLIEYFQGLEAAGNNVNSFVSGNYDSDALLFTGDFTAPVKFTGTGMSFLGKPESFLTGTFTPGTGGKFTATNSLDYFLEVVAFILTTQNDDSKNPNKVKNVSASVNATNGVINGNFTLPFTRVITNDGITITPSEYLLS